MRVKQTSRQAFQSMTEIIPVHRDKILKVMAMLKKPVNYEYIARKAGMDKHQIGRRLKELVMAKLVKLDKSESLTSTNRKASNYIITNKGKEAA